MNFTTDLHSLVQYIQEGRKNLFETAIKIEKSHKGIATKTDKLDLDRLNYLEGKILDYINRKAMERGPSCSYGRGGCLT